MWLVTEGVSEASWVAKKFNNRNLPCKLLSTPGIINTTKYQQGASEYTRGLVHFSASGDEARSTQIQVQNQVGEEIIHSVRELLE